MVVEGFRDLNVDSVVSLRRIVGRDPSLASFLRSFLAER